MCARLRNLTFGGMHIVRSQVFEGYVHSSVVELSNLAGRTSSPSTVQTTPRSLTTIRNLYLNTPISPLTQEWYPEVSPLTIAQHLPEGLVINVIGLLATNELDVYMIAALITCARPSICDINSDSFMVSYALDNSDPTASQEGKFYFGLGLSSLPETYFQSQFNILPGQEKIVLISLRIDDWIPHTAVVSYLGSTMTSEAYWYVPTILMQTEFQELLATYQ